MQGSADAKDFNPLGWRSNFLLNRNITQDNPLHTNTITQEIKQHYPANITIKGKINSWSTTMLVDLGSVATITNTELFEQVNNKFYLSSTQTNFVGTKNANVEVICETYIELEVSGKKFLTKILVANDVVQPIIIRVGFLHTYGRVLDFAEELVIYTHQDSTKVKAKIF